MRNESLGKLPFDSQYIGRFIDVFLATHIASDAERSEDRRARGNGVGLGEKDFLPIDKVARNVVEPVLAHHSSMNCLPTSRSLLNGNKGWLGHRCSDLCSIKRICREKTTN